MLRKLFVSSFYHRITNVHLEKLNIQFFIPNITFFCQNASKEHTVRTVHRHVPVNLITLIAVIKLMVPAPVSLVSVELIVNQVCLVKFYSYVNV